MTDKLSKCPACDGRGYFYCDCHPADCICGVGDETCDECGGEGIIDPSYDDFDPTPSPQPNVEPVEIPGELEMFNGKLTKVVDASRTGWWRFHAHRDRDGYCDNPARGY